MIHEIYVESHDTLHGCIWFLISLLSEFIHCFHAFCFYAVSVLLNFVEFMVKNINDNFVVFRI